MPDMLDLLGDPVTTDKGTIYDYDASMGDAASAGFDRQIDTNPVALGARALRTFNEDMNSVFGTGERVDQKTAEEEVRRRGLDLKIPAGGITRYELDTLQYLKQREIQQNTVGARAKGITGAAAGFAGGLAASFTDPINVASGFIPFVSQYRYAQWLAKAGTSTAARAGVRAGAGAIEGAAGAAVLEPLVYAGATSQQLDYGLTDSFLNVTFGGVMGGGLHVVGGAVYDARVSRALGPLDTGLRSALADMPEHKQREIFQEAVAAMERGEQFDVTPHIEAWHTSPHSFERFDLSRVGSGEGSQAFGHGIYLAESKAVAGKGGYYETQFQETHGAANTYEVRVKAEPERLLDWNKTLGEQSPEVQAAIKSIPQLDRLGPDGKGVSVYSILLNSKKADGTNFTKADVSETLKAAGVKGIRHAAEEDGGKSRNLVVFDDNDVEIVSRNGEPIAKPQPSPRDLSSLIEDAKALRTEAAFNRQFGDEADVATSRAADDAVKAQDLTPEDIAAETEMFTAHLDSMRARGLVDEGMEAELKAADEAADKMEAEAQAYEAAAVCELGA